MANHKRKRPRTKSRRSWDKHNGDDMRYWQCRWPAWWDIVFHTRPKRAQEREMEHRVMRGADPENLAWPVPKKPHNYFW